MRAAPSAACFLLTAVLRATAAAPPTAAQDVPEPADTAAVPGDNGEDGTTLIPFPVVFYQPETGVGFGGSAVLYYHMAADDDVSPPSSLAPVIVFTTKKQIILGLWNEMYFDRNRWRISSELSYSKFPTKFWGIGNDTPDEAGEDFTPKTLTVRAWPQRRIGPGWYAGFALTFIDRRLAEVESGGQLDSGDVPGAGDGQAFGLGVSLVRDTRSSTVYPRSGAYHQLLVDVFPNVWLGDYRFGRYTMDLRHYFTVGRSHVVALQALGVATSGSPPFDLLPALGGDRLLRGYFQGRYRDRGLVALQAEYRLPLFWRIGAAGFASAGQVADELGSLAIDRFHVAAGAGLRFLLARDEGLNLRADVAIGQGDSGFYFSLGEAF